MILVQVSVDNRGVLRDLKAAGHAEMGTAGSDILCSAVSILIRTAARTLEGRGVLADRADGRDRQRGEFLLTVEGDEMKDREWLSGISSYLMCGLNDLAAEYPEKIQLEVELV